MRIVGLTGGIASGKSTAALVIERLGGRVIDADRISREVTEPGAPVLQDLAEAFGYDVIRADGSLDRAALAQTIFFDADKRRRLEGILHPRITANMEKEIAEARGEGASCAVLVVPLLFEAGLDRLCDEVWTLDAPEEVRLARVVARGHSRGEALARIASQMPDEERNARADVVLDGSGDAEELERRIEALWKERIG